MSEADVEVVRDQFAAVNERDFARAMDAVGIDRLICSPVHLEPEQRRHTLERLAAMTTAPAPA